MIETQGRLDALCLRGLLRWLGIGPRSPYAGPVSSISEDDLEALRMWWALSSPVGELASRLASRPREVSPALDGFRREVSGELPGPLDASASARLQAISSDPALFVIEEMSSTWLSGPNRVMAKTLDAAKGALRATALHGRKGVLDGLALQRLSLIDDALRVDPMRELLSTPLGRARIGAHEKRQAAKAKASLYRLSWKCASTLYGLESLEHQCIVNFLSDSVLPTIEVWRRFELVCLLEISEALSAASGIPAKLDASFSSSRAAATVGEFSVWWQRSIASRPDAALDVGEQKAKQLAASLGVAAGTGRADITVEKNGRVLAIIECKWFGSEDSVTGAILNATAQLTGYARDAAHWQNESFTAILANSIVALAVRGPAPITISGGPVGCVGFADIEEGALTTWAASLLSA